MRAELLAAEGERGYGGALLEGNDDIMDVSVTPCDSASDSHAEVHVMAELVLAGQHASLQ